VVAPTIQPSIDDSCQWPNLQRLMLEKQGKTILDHTAAATGGFIDMPL